MAWIPFEGLAATLSAYAIDAKQGREIAIGHFAFLSLTPGRPPFVNSIPAFSRAATILDTASSETRAPRAVSYRLIVGSDKPAASASAVCDHPKSPRAARI
jgi:hypothetical protein